MTAPINDPGNGGTLLVQGNFSSRGGYTVTGSAKVLDNAGVKSVRLENFSSSNGPDLKVYLAKDINAASFHEPGKFKISFREPELYPYWNAGYSPI